MPTRAFQSGCAIACFNPRPSREGRSDRSVLHLQSRCFNPRPSREGRSNRNPPRPARAGFNPRPSREGRSTASPATCRNSMFQSAPLSRGAMMAGSATTCPHCVSIRAPLARGDPIHHRCRRIPRCFNPRPSREGRSLATPARPPDLRFQSAPLSRGAIFHAGHGGNCRTFQSAPLSRGAMPRAIVVGEDQPVSIRAPLARGDICSLVTSQSSRCFNPRPSRAGGGVNVG